jgi:hypothetical protein
MNELEKEADELIEELRSLLIEAKALRIALEIVFGVKNNGFY